MKLFYRGDSSLHFLCSIWVGLPFSAKKKKINYGELTRGIVIRIV